MGRWYNMRSIDEPMPSWVSPTHAGVIRRAAKEIFGRCDARTYIDTVRRDINPEPIDAKIQTIREGLKCK